MILEVKGWQHIFFTKQKISNEIIEEKAFQNGDAFMCLTRRHVLKKMTQIYRNNYHFKAGI